MRCPLAAILFTGVSLLFSAPLAAAEVDHYQPEPSETLEQAVANLQEYNARLEKLVSREELSAGEMEQVHQLTYTLENALKRINTEMSDIAGKLETVHLASERREAGTVNEFGEAYLEKIRILVP